MAVYTHLEPDELVGLAEEYGLGEVLEARPIAEGVENSNYLLLTRGDMGPDRHILTVYEKRVDPADLPFFLGLMDHLAAKGLAVPQPLRRADGEMLTSLRGGAKWAALVTFLDGESPVEVKPAHLKAMGEQMAALHGAVDDFTLSRPNDLSLAGWEKLAAVIGPRADEIAPGLAKEIAEELDYLRPRWPDDLTGDVVHADLFVDNVFFKDDRLSGIIDFYFACHDFFLYDLAITMNAWCFEGNHFDKAKAAALIMAYRAHSTLPEEEWEYLPLLARGAALRFLLTRAYDWLNRQEGALVTMKDPLEYLAKLKFHRNVMEWKVYAGPYFIGNEPGSLFTEEYRRKKWRSRTTLASAPKWMKYSLMLLVVGGMAPKVFGYGCILRRTAEPICYGSKVLGHWWKIVLVYDQIFFFSSLFVCALLVSLAHYLEDRRK